MGVTKKKNQFIHQHMLFYMDSAFTRLGRNKFELRGVSSSQDKRSEEVAGENTE